MGRSRVLVGFLAIAIALVIGFQALPAQACDSCGGRGGYYGARYYDRWDCYSHRPYHYHYSVVHHYHHHHWHDYDDYPRRGCGYYRPWWGYHRHRHCYY
jgi:hypothetical protein